MGKIPSAEYCCSPLFLIISIPQKTISKMIKSYFNTIGEGCGLKFSFVVGCIWAQLYFEKAEPLLRMESSNYFLVSQQ